MVAFGRISRFSGFWVSEILINKMMKIFSYLNNSKAQNRTAAKRESKKNAKPVQLIKCELI